jgi:hypothetical protein
LVIAISSCLRLAFEEEPGRRSAAKMLTKDEAQSFDHNNVLAELSNELAITHSQIRYVSRKRADHRSEKRPPSGRSLVAQFAQDSVMPLSEHGN